MIAPFLWVIEFVSLYLPTIINEIVIMVSSARSLPIQGVLPTNADDSTVNVS
jgi:hypothetical protein